MDIIRTIMEVFPAKQKEVLQTLISLIEPLGKKNGCLSYGIYCDIEDKNIFNLISEWESRQHIANYMMSGRFSVLLGIKSLLCKPIEIKIFTASDFEEIKAGNVVNHKIKLIYPVSMRKGVC